MEKESELKIIRERLAYIGRFMESISPKLSKYRELQEEKETLRKQLKSLATNSNK